MKPWLLVEDEPDISEMLLAVFDIWEIDGVVHQNGEETLAWLESIHRGEIDTIPELALIDIRLIGDIDGITVAQKLRSSPVLKKMVIVLNTAYALTEQEKQQCLRISGADHVMNKPLPRFEILYEELQVLIQQKAADAQTYENEEILPAAIETVNQPAPYDLRIANDLTQTKMRNLSPGGSISRQALNLLKNAILAVSGGTLIAIIGLAVSVIPLVGREGSFTKLYEISTQAFMIVGVILASSGLWLVGCAYRRRKLDDKFFREVAVKLCDQFDSRFTYISNLNVRGLKGIDAVIVGPPGLLVLRLLDNRGDLYQEHGYWLQQGKKGDFIPLNFNPARELLSDIRRLRSKLAQHAMSEFPIFGIIVSLRSSTDVQYHTSGEVFPFSHVSTLVDSLNQNYLGRERVTMRAVRAVLKQLHVPLDA